MKERTFETSDLYYGAYLLVKGNELTKAALNGDGYKKQVTFSFQGSDVLKNAHEYISGREKVNINEFRAQMNHLKRLTFETLKKY